MPSLKFELFELICDELRARRERIITESVLSADQLEELRDDYGALSDESAMGRALNDLSDHFKSKGARMPFRHDLKTGRFWARDPDFIKFVSDARGVRGTGLPDAKWFEKQAWVRLSTRLTGLLDHVGFPRKKAKQRKQLIAHLRNLGFGDDALEPNDKDGGLDILWLPPLGAVPIRPIVSLQCKNSGFDQQEALASAGQAQRTIGRHTHMRMGGTYILAVIFNDYIDRAFESKAKGWNFVPLGLSDLAALRKKIRTVSLS